MADVAETSTIPHEKKVVLFGKMGAGKSTIANVLVTGGIEPVKFPYSDGTQGCTRSPKQLSERNWTVLDTVGLGTAPPLSSVDTSKPEDQLKAYLKGLKGEYSHIIYVMKGERVSEIDQMVWFLFTQIFEGGEDAFVILFTGVDEQWLEIQRPALPKEMKAVRNICAVNIPPVHRNVRLESQYAEIRKEEIEKLEKTLEDIFAERDYKYVTPEISKMDAEGLTIKSKTIIERVVEKLKSLFKKENWPDVIRVLSSVVSITSSVVSLTAAILSAVPL